MSWNDICRENFASVSLSGCHSKLLLGIMMMQISS